MRHAAVRRASRVWQECAVHVRGTLRNYGVQGELRRLDEYAAGTRGGGWAAFVADFAFYCRSQGMSRDETAMHVATTAEQIVLGAFDTSDAA
ncbi:hypothetical protein [Gemmatimonas aurantiaca]|nr:hypothetical protein [Gemmatimonas aurantiaca]